MRLRRGDRITFVSNGIRKGERIEATYDGSVGQRTGAVYVIVDGFRTSIGPAVVRTIEKV